MLLLLLLPLPGRMLYAHHYLKHFMCVISFNTLNNPTTEVPRFLFYREETEAQEWSRMLPKVTVYMVDKQAVWLQVHALGG